MTESKLNSLAADLEDTPTISFHSMLKALIMRARDLGTTLPIPSKSVSKRERTRSRDQSISFAEKHFELLAESAVQFCNGKTSHSKKLKESVRAALLETDEDERAQHLVNGLNTTLMAYHGKAVGDLQHTPGDGDLIFVVNEHDTAVLKDKLAIAGTTLRHLSEVSPTPGIDCTKSFKQWIDRIKTRAWKRDNKVCQLPWHDVWHCWDVNIVDIIDSIEFPAFTVMETMGQEEASETITGGNDDPEHSSTTVGKRKRRATTPRPDAPEPDVSPSDDRRSSDIKFNASCSGVELLCSKWDRTHSIGVLVKDKWLSLRWYDPQGCIVSEPINIVTHMPLLVVVIVLFQRFSPRMRGLSDLNLSAQLDGEQVPLAVPMTVHKRWQLKGRHAVFATPIRKPPRTQPGQSTRVPSHSRNTRARSRIAPNPVDSLFFKISWREEHRDGEGSIIAKAKERANYYLPNPEHVTDHLPEVKRNQDCDDLSTRHIREYLDLSTKGARVPSVMIMQKLKPLGNVKPAQFSLIIWQIIRCLYLLWEIGIAHGDLSFWNIMVNTSHEPPIAVLIDFDYAAVITPGSRSAKNPDAERIGTKPFIALDLGDATDPLKHVFRHDLESVLWCMLWYCQEQPSWLEGSFTSVRNAKWGWSDTVKPDRPPSNIREGSETLWRPITKALVAWVDADFDTPLEHKSDTEWLEIIHHHLSCPPELGSEWMSFRIPPARVRRSDKSSTS